MSDLDRLHQCLAPPRLNEIKRFREVGVSPEALSAPELPARADVVFHDDRHVYQGGQAIVGAVSTQRAEGGVADERGNQADGAIDARAIAFAPGAALFGPDADRDALPEGRVDGQEALPDARRGKGQRRAPR